MKLALNGAPTIGTLDGANVEIREKVGAENFFLFGLTADEAGARRQEPEFARRAIAASQRLSGAIEQIASGRFSPDDTDRYKPLIDSLRTDDHFLVTCDFDVYFAKQREVDVVFRDVRQWFRMAASNTANIGTFSSDRAVREYAREIWGVEIEANA